jgi:hypothetical protein
MLSICSTFEEWYIEDGNYPPLKKGDKVNLSFNMQIKNIEIIEDEIYNFNKIKYSEYEFSGKVIYNYSSIIIIDTNNFMFYIENKKNLDIPLNAFVKGNGKLLVDYYVWVGNYGKRGENPPDIFYNFKIDKILEINILENYIQETKNGFTLPCSLTSDYFNDTDIGEIDKMDIEKGFSFYLLVLTEINEQIKRTYLR